MTSLESELKALVAADRVLVHEQDKLYASRDMATHVSASLPMFVVQIQTQQELIDAVRCCLSHQTPIVMRACGTGKSGGAVADSQSVVMDVSCLNRILSIDTKNLYAEVEPGVILADLQEAVKAHNLFYPPDPASAHICSIGGNVAENAGGPSTFKYGTTKDYLLGGQAILANGELIDFGKRCVKGVVGYDMSSLLCGSEGTLAVFTRLILRLLPRPLSESMGVFFFADEDAALHAVNVVLTQGHRPKTIEFIDRHGLLGLAQCASFELPENTYAALLIQCDATAVGAAEQELAAIALSLASLVAHLRLLKSKSEQDAMWYLRSDLSDIYRKLLGHKISEDIAVPLGELVRFKQEVEKLAQPPHIQCGLFGHAGDGNLHVQIMFDHERHRAAAEAIRHEVLMLVVRFSGTLAAEHGIGLQKKAYMQYEQSVALIELQKRIKRAFDPHNLFNPGKIFDI